jgi:hypothetical protein
MRVARGSLFLLILTLVGVVWGASFFGILAQDREFQLSSNYAVTEPLDARIREMLGPDSARTHAEHCLQRSRIDEACVFVRMASDFPRCPLFEANENCRAIELRASLLNVPEIRALVERDTVEFCTFKLAAPLPPDEGISSISVVGCRHPGSPFRLFYRERPTICVVPLGDGDQPPPMHVFAVKGGRRVHHYWCDRIQQINDASGAE